MDYLVAKSVGQICGVKLFVMKERGNPVLQCRAVKLFHCASSYLLAASRRTKTMVPSGDLRSPRSRLSFEDVAIFADVVGAAAGECGCRDGLMFRLQFANKLGRHVVGITAVTLIIAFAIWNQLIGVKLLEIVMSACSLNDELQFPM